MLLQLDSQGLAATVRGATTYYDWARVAVRPIVSGIAFVLPPRTFHLLPWSALTIDDAGRLRALLARAARESRHDLPGPHTQFRANWRGSHARIGSVD